MPLADRLAGCLSNLRVLLRATAKRVLDLRHPLFDRYLAIRIPQRSNCPPRVTADMVSRVLVIRLDELGDFVCTIPFLRAIRGNYTNAKITLVANKRVAALAEVCPYLDEFIGMDLPRRKPPFDQILTSWAARRFAVKHLVNRDFEIAIIPRSDIDNGGALEMAYHAGIPHRIGYDETVFPLKRIKNAGYHRLLTQIVNPVSDLHEVRQSLNVAEFLGAAVTNAKLELWTRDADDAAAERLLIPFREHHRPLVAVAPSANLPRRIWPSHKFGELAATLHRKIGAQFLVIGGPDAEAIAYDLVNKSALTSKHILNLAGATTLRETVALLRSCDLFVGNDSGPMHLAAAAGIPCVEISCHPHGGSEVHANSPLRYAPWLVRHAILRPAAAMPPCESSCLMHHAHCIRLVTVESVASAATGLLERTQ